MDFSSMAGKERRHYFIYLLLLTVTGVVLLSVVFLRKMSSPFHNDLAFEMRMLEDAKKFNDRQREIYPFLAKVFDKIDVIPISQLRVATETDITGDIKDIANVGSDQQLNDVRKENYPQIAQFLVMYLTDKKIAAARLENIAQYEKQYTECSIGFKEKEQRLGQKNAAIAARSNN